MEVLDASDAIHPVKQTGFDSVVAQVVHHWNQIILDLKNWATLGKVSDSPVTSVAIARG